MVLGMKGRMELGEHSRRCIRRRGCRGMPVSILNKGSRDSMQQLCSWSSMTHWGMKSNNGNSRRVVKSRGKGSRSNW
jgi:hypothetical protein